LRPRTQDGAAISYAAIERRLDRIERGMGEHDEQLRQIFEALRQLIAPPVPDLATPASDCAIDHPGAGSMSRAFRAAANAVRMPPGPVRR